MKILLTTFLLFLVNFINGQTIGEFELWDTIHIASYQDELVNDHNIQDPVGGIPNEWKPLNGFGVTRTTDSHVDDFAIILHNWYAYVEEEIQYKNKVSEFPLSISGYYKFVRESGLPDSIMAKAEISIVNTEKEVIGHASFNLDTCSSYQFFQIPISILTNGQPDSIEINFKNSNYSSLCKNNVCNFLYLDHVTIDYTTNTVEQEMKENIIYPNPTEGILYWENENHVYRSVEVYDMKGRLIKKVRATEELNIERLPAGYYILKIFTDDKFESVKVLKL